MMDLTRLEDDDTEAEIDHLCARADTAFGHPAAVCIPPQFVAAAGRSLHSRGLTGKVRVATVANFPGGTDDEQAVAGCIRDAVAAGADEVDVVFPYRAWLAGDRARCRATMAACRDACDGHVLKVILETGELHRPEVIRSVAEGAIAADADFLKTSTGKVAVNATPQAARILLEAIRDSGRDVGCKVSGGIRTTADARVYLDLAAEILGPDWLIPARFRIGASGLLDDLLGVLEAG